MKTSRIFVRVGDDDKLRMVEQASKAGLSLSEWLLRIADYGIDHPSVIYVHGRSQHRRASGRRCAECVRIGRRYCDSCRWRVMGNAKTRTTSNIAGHEHGPQRPAF